MGILVPAPTTQPPGQPIPSIRQPFFFAHFGKEQHLSAFFQPLAVLYFDFGFGIIFADTLVDGVGNAARHRVAAPRARRVVELFILVEMLEIDAFRLENGGKFLERDDEIHVAAHRAAGSLQLFRRTKAPRIPRAPRGVFS